MGPDKEQTRKRLEEETRKISSWNRLGMDKEKIRKRIVEEGDHEIGAGKLPEYEKPVLLIDEKMRDDINAARKKMNDDMDEARKNLYAEAKAGFEKIDKEIGEILDDWDNSWKQIDMNLQEQRLRNKWRMRGLRVLLFVWGGAMLTVLGIILYMFFVDPGGAG